MLSCRRHHHVPVDPKAVVSQVARKSSTHISETDTGAYVAVCHNTLKCVKLQYRLEPTNAPSVAIPAYAPSVAIPIKSPVIIPAYAPSVSLPAYAPSVSILTYTPSIALPAYAPSVASASSFSLPHGRRALTPDSSPSLHVSIKAKCTHI